MRSFLLVVAALLAGVGAALGVLVITGDTSSSGYAAIKQMLATVRQFPDAQIAFSVYVPGNPLADLSLVVDQSTNDPQVNLDAAGQRANSEIFVFLAKQPVLDLIVAGNNAYARIDFLLLRSIFPTSAEQTAVNSLQAQAGNRWLALPPGLINGFAGTGGPSGITAGEVREYVAAVEQAVRSHAVVSSGVSASGADGIVVTGPIGPLVSAALSARRPPRRHRRPPPRAQLAGRSGGDLPDRLLQRLRRRPPPGGPRDEARGLSDGGRRRHQPQPRHDRPAEGCPALPALLGRGPPQARQ